MWSLVPLPESGLAQLIAFTSRMWQRSSDMVHRLLREHVNPVFVWSNNNSTAPFTNNSFHQQAPTFRALSGQGYIFIYKVHEQFKLPPINGKDPMCQDDSPFPTTPVSPLASLLPSTVSSLSQLPKFKKSTSLDCSVFVQHPGKGQDVTFPVTPTCPLTPPPKGTRSGRPECSSATY